jgi:hypothetical protein
MSDKAKIVKELFTELNNNKLINGFIMCGDDGVQFQAKDGTMIILDIVKFMDLTKEEKQEIDKNATNVVKKLLNKSK